MNKFCSEGGKKIKFGDILTEEHTQKNIWFFSVNLDLNLGTIRRIRIDIIFIEKTKGLDNFAGKNVSSAQNMLSLRMTCQVTN